MHAGFLQFLTNSDLQAAKAAAYLSCNQNSSHETNYFTPDFFIVFYNAECAGFRPVETGQGETF